MPDIVQGGQLGGGGGGGVLAVLPIPGQEVPDKAGRQIVEGTARAVGSVIGRVVSVVEDLPLGAGQTAVGPIEHAPVKFGILAPAAAWILNRTRPNPLTGISKFVFLFPSGVVFNALVDPVPANTIEAEQLAIEEAARAAAAASRPIPPTPPMWRADP